jgi:hypothetical protein
MNHIKILGWSGAVVSVIMFYGTFFTAYLHPTKSVVVKLDVFGEANLEAIALLLLAIPTIIYLWKTSGDDKHE